MTSNLSCVGLGVAGPDELGDLVRAVVARSTPTSREKNGRLYEWYDPSGARLTVGVGADGTVEDLIPSYDGRPGVELSGLTLLHDEVVAADVVQDGETATRVAADLLQWRSLPLTRPSARASLTAFGVEVGLHASPEAFAASAASLLTPGSEHEPRPDDLREGQVWPLRMAAESFLSYGMFAQAAEAVPTARLAGSVMSVTTQTVELTGQTFHAARVRSVGMEVDVCIAAADHTTPPVVGGVVSGTVYLVASLEPDATPRRRWFGRR